LWWVLTLTNGCWRLSVEECSEISINPYLPKLPFNDYDLVFQNLSYWEKCKYVDANNDGNIEEKEFFLFSRNIQEAVNSEWSFENRWRQQSCSHCSWYPNLDSTLCSTPTTGLNSTEPSKRRTSIDQMRRKTPLKNISVCLTSWIDEKASSDDELYVCDTECEDFGDCSDCGSSSMCFILTIFFSLGDLNNDQKLSIDECVGM
jgi:hypothetical protein